MKGIQERKLMFEVKIRKDQDAFSLLYDTYVEKIYRFVYFKIPLKEEAEDITSDVFLKVWTYLSDNPHKEIKSFSGLVYRVARNTIIDFYRNRSKKRECSVEEIETLAVEDKGYVGAEMNQELENLMLVLTKLKQEYQEILVLRYIEELSISEVAEILSKSKTSVRVTLHRATKKLKELLGNQ